MGGGWDGDSGGKWGQIGDVWGVLYNLSLLRSSERWKWRIWRVYECRDVCARMYVVWSVACEISMKIHQIAPKRGAQKR